MEQSLSNQSDQAHLSRVIEQLASPDRHVQYQAELALRQIGASAMDAVIRGLQHPHPQVRRYCADFMDHLGDDRCIEPLITLTRDAVPHVRRQAIHSLSCQRCKSLPLSVDLTDLLIDHALHDPSAKVRGEAVFGLSMQAPSERAMQMLEALIAELEAHGPMTEQQRKLRNGASYSLALQRRGQVGSRCER